MTKDAIKNYLLEHLTPPHQLEEITQKEAELFNKIFPDPTFSITPDSLVLHILILLKRQREEIKQDLLSIAEKNESEELRIAINNYFV